MMNQVLKNSLNEKSPAPLINMLLIEDNQIDVALFERTVRKTNTPHTLKHSFTLKDAIVLINNNKFDVVILDFNLPDSFGIDSIKAILAANPELPIIVLTNDDNAEASDQAIINGAQDYLSKEDLKPGQIIRAIRNSIQRKKMEFQINEKQDQIRIILDKSPISIWTTDKELNITSNVGGIGIEYFNYKENLLVGKNLKDFFIDKGTDFEIIKLHQKAMQGAHSEAIIPIQNYFIKYFTEPVKDINNNVVGTMGLAIDITELQKAIDAANRASRKKSEFLANMTHELRTPMNSLMAMADLLAETFLDKRQKKYIQLFQKSGENLITLINDILDFSKIEAGELKIETIEFDLNYCLHMCAELMAVKARSKDLDLIFKNNLDSHINVISDPTRLKQILVNLLSNAIKFTQKGHVILSVDQVEDNLLFCVEDTGVGIAQDKLQSIFLNYTQADETITRNYGGTGLGLSITKQLVEMMGGRVWAESQVGIGSQFFVQLPLRVKKQEPKVAKPVLDQKNVLIIDDNKFESELLAKMLTSCGANFVICSSGKGALEYLRMNDKYDMIFVDCRMEIGGFETIKMIETEVKIASRTIMMLPPGHRKGDHFKIREMRLGGHLVKPLFQDDVYLSILKFQEGTHIYINDEQQKPVPERVILVVEDNELQQEKLKLDLAELGLRILIANNGQEALDIINENIVHAIVSDIRMPILSGIELFQRLNSNGLKIPFVFLSAYPEEIARSKEFDFGVVSCIQRPYDKDILINVVDNAVRFGAERGVIALPDDNSIEKIRNKFKKVRQDVEELKRTTSLTDYSDSKSSTNVVTQQEIEKEASLNINEERSEVQSKKAKIKVLIAEDTEENRDVLQFYFEGTEIDATYVENGLQAIEEYQKQSFDIILMDMQMPIMDGFEATTKIRKIEAEKAIKPIPIVALTASAMDLQRKSCLAAGCTDFLAKPIKRDKLLNTIHEYKNKTSQSEDYMTALKKQTEQLRSDLSPDSHGTKITVEVDKRLEPIMPKFLKKRFEDVELLNHAIINQEFKIIKDRAHIIAGSGGGYGMDQLSLIGSQMEDAAIKNNIEEIKGIFEQYKNYIENVEVRYV